MSVVGTCSVCGGAVTMPDAWYGIFPPTPSCASCGATKKQPHGPVVEMEPSEKVKETLEKLDLTKRIGK